MRRHLIGGAIVAAMVSGTALAARESDEIACAGRLAKSAFTAFPMTGADLMAMTSPTGMLAATARIATAVQGGLRGCLDEAYAEGRRDGWWASLLLIAGTFAAGGAAGFVLGRRRGVLSIYDPKDGALR